MGIKEAIKQTKFKSPLQKAMVNIIYSHNWLRDIQQDIFKKNNILAQHYNVLRIVLGKSPNPVSPSEIKEVMLDKGRDLTRLVDKMVTLGLLERKLCDYNRRKMEISVTEKGAKISTEIEKKLNTVTKEKFKLTEEEAEQLSNLLDKMREG